LSNATSSIEPAAPAPEPDKPKVELPVVKNHGLVNIGNVRKVLFVSQPKDKKEGPFYYSLAEGEKSDDGKLSWSKSILTRKEWTSSARAWR